MAKCKVSLVDLKNMVSQCVDSYPEIPEAMEFVIVGVADPERGWMIMTNPADRIAYPEADKAFQNIQETLRAFYEIG